MTQSSMHTARGQPAPLRAAVVTAATRSPEECPNRVCAGRWARANHQTRVQTGPASPFRIA
eukprot:11214784-Lingulodinium_polyedra.AAC.1